MNINVPVMLTSKKFWAAAIAAVLSYFALSRDMTPQEVALITGPFYAYIGAQGLADLGKERKEGTA